MEFTEGSHIDLSGYVNLLKSRRATFDETHPQKIEHSFQELGIEMQKFFGKNIWYLFYKHKEDDLRYAFSICQKKNKRSIPYLLGIIKHKYKGL